VRGATPQTLQAFRTLKKFNSRPPAGGASRG